MKGKNPVLKIAGVLLLVVLVLFAVGMAVSALSGNATGLVYEKKDDTIDAAEVSEVRIRARNMPVTVTPSNGSVITLHYYSCEKDPYEVSLDRGVLTLEYKKDILFGVSSWFAGVFNVFRPSNPTVEVIVPAAYAGTLQLDSSNAPVNASGLTKAGDLRIQTSNAPIVVNHVSAFTVYAHTSNGGVTLDQVTASGVVDLRSSNGALTAKQVEARDQLRMETSNGRIVADQVTSAAIEFKSSNGSITGSVEGKRSDYTISSTTSNGDDNLGDGGKGPFRLTVNTSNGHIDIRFLGE